MMTEIFLNKILSKVLHAKVFRFYIIRSRYFHSAHSTMYHATVMLNNFQLAAQE